MQVNKTTSRKGCALAACICCAFNVATAAPVAIPHTFTSGTPAVAAEVNQNFSAIVSAVNDSDSAVESLEQLNQELQSEISRLKDDLNGSVRQITLQANIDTFIGTLVASAQASEAVLESPIGDP